MFSCGSHNGFISTINAVLSFQLLFLCFHFYSTVLSLGQAFAGGGAWGSAAVPHDRATCQGQPGLPRELPQPQTPLHDENSALNTLRESRASCQAGPGKAQSPAKVLDLMEQTGSSSGMSPVVPAALGVPRLR